MDTTPVNLLERQAAMDFAHRLTTLRKARGLTQQTLADTIGVHVTQLRRYEAGTNQPTLDVLRALAIALAVTTDDLVFNEDERGPKTHHCASTPPPSISSTPTNARASAPSSKAPSCATKPDDSPPADRYSGRDDSRRSSPSRARSAFA